MEKVRDLWHVSQRRKADGALTSMTSTASARLKMMPKGATKKQAMDRLEEIRKQVEWRCFLAHQTNSEVFRSGKRLAGMEKDQHSEKHF